MAIRLLTYNIHKGIGGVDRRYDLDRIVAVLAHYVPDVALLQEVDDGVPRSRRHRQVELLAEATGLTHTAYQPNVRLREGHYGNAVLSRFPLADAADVDLTVPLKKRRRALAVRCLVEREDSQASLIFVNVHLGLAEVERRIQLRRLLRHDAVARHHATTPIVIGGDFNDVWGRLGRKTLEPAGFQLASGQVRTFPAAAAVRRLDRIYLRGPLVAIHAAVGRTQVARRASDHLPVAVDLEWESIAAAGDERGN